MLETRGLSKIFVDAEGSITAVDNVSLTFAPGKIYGIVGANGAGKTTLIKLMSSIVIPSAGNVYFDGQPLYPRNFKLLTSVGAILEGSRNIFWSFTPLQNVRYFALLKGVPIRTAFPRALKLFEQLGLTDKLDVPVRNLSQGMKQKIAIAICMLHDPHVLLMDEPTNGLDPMSSHAMQEIIRETARSNGKIVIITSHQLHLLEKIADAVLFMENGRVKQFDSLENLKALASKRLYHITVAKDKADAFLKIVPAARHMAGNGTTALFELECANGELDRILRLLAESSIVLLDIEKVTPSLEDIYMERTGQ